jgi:hypothetical protein
VGGMRTIYRGVARRVIEDGLWRLLSDDAPQSCGSDAAQYDVTILHKRVTAGVRWGKRGCTSSSSEAIADLTPETLTGELMGSCRLMPTAS